MNRQPIKSLPYAVLTLFALHLLPVPTAGAQRNWVAKGPVTAAWSDPNNWSPSGVPEDGDQLSFDFESFPIPSATTMVNDIVGLSVQQLAFPSGSWQLSGNELGVRSAIGNSGDGFVEIHCAVRLDGIAVTTFSALSTLPSDTSDLRLTGPINLNGHTLRLAARSDATIELSGAISGNGLIRIDVETLGYFGEAGEVKFSGTEANTFTGNVTMGSQAHDLILEHAGARLVLDKQSATAIPAGLVAGTNAIVRLNRPHQIADTAAVTLGAGAYFLLQGNTETIGTLNMMGSYSGLAGYRPESGGSVVDTGGATLSVQGPISAINYFANNVPTIRGKLGLPPGTHAISVSGNQFYGLDIEAQILGDGGFTKIGAAGLLVRGNNIFNGELTVAQGILAAAHNNAFGSVAGFTVLTNDGVLILSDVAVYGESLFARGNRVFSAESAGAWAEAVGTNLWSGPIILDSNLVLTAFGPSRLNLNGLISGPGGLHCLGGTVEISGTDANTFTGGVLALNPLLLLNKSAGLTAFGGPLRVGGGDESQKEVRWIQDYQRIGADVTLFPDALVNLSNHRDDFGPVTFNSGTIATGGSGELGLYGLLTVNPASRPALISGRLGLPPGLHEFLVGDGAAFPDLQIDATVLGAGHLRKTGSGQMWLTTANTYSGLTTVAGGALSVLHPNGLGGAVTGTTVNDGATLELNFAGTMPEPLAIRGVGAGGNGALGVFNNLTLRTPQPSIFAAIDLTTHATIGVVPGAQLTVDGTISGAGHLTKTGAGTLWFGGNDHNTYSGETFINEGTLIMGKPTGTTAVPGPLSIGTASGLSATAANVASYQVIGNIFVNRNGLYYLNGQVENVDHLWLMEGGDVQTSPPGVLFLKAGGSIQVLPGAISDPATIGGLLEIEAGAHTVNVAATTGLTLGGPDLDITAQVTSSGGAITLNKAGAGKLRFSANNLYTGSTVVNAGTVQVDGVQTASSTLVHNGARVTGIGRVGTIDFVGRDGVVAPGTSAGVFETGLFNANALGGILELEFNGPTAGSDYDRLRVTGSVNLTGMTLRALVNYIAATNTQFAIVVNDLSDPVIGTFNGLSEGASVMAGEQVFQITYAGGTGNDVVLTKLSDVIRPHLAIEHVPPASVRLLWPNIGPSFTLQSSTNSSGTNWIAVMPPPVVTGTNNVVTNATDAARKFYRLFSP